MRSIVFIVAVARPHCCFAPAVADGIPGLQRGSQSAGNYPLSKSRTAGGRAAGRRLSSYRVETPVIVAPPVVVRRPVFIEPPYIVARPRVVFEPRLYAYNPGPPVVRFGPPGRHLGHFRHGY